MFVRRLFITGLAVWAVATVALRFVGAHVLAPDAPVRSTLLLVASIPLSALLVRRLCRAAGLTRERWLSGAVALLLPTLLLDPFSSAFFPLVFPNIPAGAAGVFGGWMLSCCAGGLLGAIDPGRRPA
jgi:hypothetical protein